MSCYEWERGEIIIPKDQWAGFKKALRDAYNGALARDLKLLEQAIAKVRAANKGRRNVDWSTSLMAELQRTERRFNHYYGNSVESVYPLELLDADRLPGTILVRKERVGRDGTKQVVTKLGAIKKKDLPLANGKTVRFEADLGQIGLKDSTHSVVWEVQENNHACGSSRAALMGKTLFEILGRVQWKRNSGGNIFGNDEYTRDSGRDSVGGGGSYLKSSYGPLGDLSGAASVRRRIV